MTVSLVKGQNVDMTKEAGSAGLAKITVGLGWDVNTRQGAEFDLDASAIVTDANGKVLSDDYFVFYGHKNSPENEVIHHGDNLTGEGEGDDEQISVDLSKLPSTADKVVIVVSIYQADTRNQKFGDVNNSFVRVVNDADGAELTRYDLQEDLSTETAMVFGEIYRKDGAWKFRAVGSGYANGLQGIARDYGVNA